MSDEMTIMMEHDEVLDKIGGCGRFTKLAAFITVTAMISGDLINNNLAFYELMPKYECQQSDNSW